MHRRTRAHPPILIHASTCMHRHIRVPVSLPSRRPLPHVGASEQRPLVHTLLMQSAATRQVAETPHWRSQSSPQSTSPSFKSRMRFMQVAGCRHTPVLHTPLRQSCGHVCQALVMLMSLYCDLPCPAWMVKHTGPHTCTGSATPERLNTPCRWHSCLGTRRHHSPHLNHGKQAQSKAMRGVPASGGHAMRNRHRCTAAYPFLGRP